MEPKSLLLERRIERIDRVVADRLASPVLVLGGVHDPHNLAAVLRTAEGLGLQEVHVVAGPKGFHPSQAVTQGADKWLDVIRHPGAAACAGALHDRGFRLFASLLDDRAVPLEALPADGKLALVFGNEHAGVGPELAALCDGVFRIPMYGFTQSFNVSVAAGIALHHVASASRARGAALPEGERSVLRERFYALAVKQGRRLGLR
ncbi:MAG TPA: RNA methyltransferase [Myxococcales bacterium]|nr:RNA methyltransferase [Myxococcales bacterium]